MAPRHHSATRHVAPTRVELGTRTIFNLLGPLSNPAGVKRQLVGVFAPEWVEPVAEVLGRLGSEHAWVVHGDGMDEITTAGTTHVAELKGGKVSVFELTPEQVGLKRASLADLRGGDLQKRQIAPLKSAKLARFSPTCSGVSSTPKKPCRLQLGAPGGAGGGDFVHAVAVNHPGMLADRPSAFPPPARPIPARTHRPTGVRRPDWTAGRAD